MTVEIPKDKWPGQVRTVTLGATEADGGTRARTVTIGGEKTLPFLHFETPSPNRPVVAMQMTAPAPVDWSPLLMEKWGDTCADSARWAKACEEAGADVLEVMLGLKDPAGNDMNPDYAVSAVRSVLEATTLPVVVLGPGQAAIDNEILVPVADAAKGERLAIGLCTDSNYRTIVAAAIANGHVVVGRTPMDVNLAKQLNILMTDMGLPLDRIVMDPTTGALGYGIEYGFSVMERLRLAALQGDAMTQLPLMVDPGFEAWKTKEAKVGEGVPESWGDWEKRAVNWENFTALTLIEAGANMVVVRHPESVRRIRLAIDELMTTGQDS